jgi:hypothetical protein
MGKNHTAIVLAGVVRRNEKPSGLNEVFMNGCPGALQPRRPARVAGGTGSGALGMR